MPDAGDPPVNGFTTLQIFSFIAESTPTAAQMQCRNFMQQQSSIAMWQCGGSNSTHPGRGLGRGKGKKSIKIN